MLDITCALCCCDGVRMYDVVVCCMLCVGHDVLREFDGRWVV